MRCIYLLIYLIFFSANVYLVKTHDYGKQFFELATNNFNNSGEMSLQKIHLIRVPKASSTSLSVIARRMVGCTPPGPCCKWPGDPPGSCPSKELYACNSKVVGCTNHNPYYNSLLSLNIKSITMLREPKSRSVSAFFYPGMHHNSNCNATRDECFLEYTSGEKWKNIAVKMMCGLFAYSPDRVCELNSDCKHSLQLALKNLDKLHFLGVAEMWELSVLLLHAKFPSISPDFSEFMLGSSGEKNVQSHDNSPAKDSKSRLLSVTRANDNEEYRLFRRTAPERFAAQLHEQNGLDEVLYKHAVERMCNDLHSSGLWSQAIVKEYWKNKSPIKTELCS